MNPFNHFPHIYCINLDSRPDRWEKAQAEFASIGIADRVQRFPGCVHEYGKQGCKDSYLQLFKHARDNNIEHLVCFEDDVHFINDPLETLNKALQQTEGVKWDMMYLGASIVQPMEYFSPNTYKITGAYATHAVILSGRIMDDLIQLYEATNPIKDFNDYNDYILSQYQYKSLALICNPICAVQSAGYSDLQMAEVDYGWQEPQFNSYKP